MTTTAIATPRLKRQGLPSSKKSHEAPKYARAYRSMTDDELVELTRAGEPAAFGELVRRYQNKVNSLALRITKSETDAQEVVQEVFLNAYAKIDSFKGTAAFSSWLYRVAANGALMLLRSRKKDAYELWENGVFRSEQIVGQPAEWSVLADQMMERKQLAQLLEQEFAALPDRYRKILSLRELEGLSNREISSSLGLSVAAVKSRLHRARLMLRKRLSACPGLEARYAVGAAH